MRHVINKQTFDEIGNHKVAEQTHLVNLLGTYGTNIPKYPPPAGQGAQTNRVSQFSVKNTVNFVLRKSSQ